jgi:hypothetical protein
MKVITAKEYLKRNPKARGTLMEQCLKVGASMASQKVGDFRVRKVKGGFRSAILIEVNSREAVWVESFFAKDGIEILQTKKGIRVGPPASFRRWLADLPKSPAKARRLSQKVLDDVKNQLFLK